MSSFQLAPGGRSDGQHWPSERLAGFPVALASQRTVMPESGNPTSRGPPCAVDYRHGTRMVCPSPLGTICQRTLPDRALCQGTKSRRKPVRCSGSADAAGGEAGSFWRTAQRSARARPAALMAEARLFMQGRNILLETGVPFCYPTGSWVAVEVNGRLEPGSRTGWQEKEPFAFRAHVQSWAPWGFCGESVDESTSGETGW
jgi:hypothetical protein